MNNSLGESFVKGYKSCLGSRKQEMAGPPVEDQHVCIGRDRTQTTAGAFWEDGVFQMSLKGALGGRWDVYTLWSHCEEAKVQRAHSYRF